MNIPCHWIRLVEPIEIRQDPTSDYVGIRCIPPKADRIRWPFCRILFSRIPKRKQSEQEPIGSHHLRPYDHTRCDRIRQSECIGKKQLRVRSCRIPTLTKVKYTLQNGLMCIFHQKILRSRDEIWMHMDFSYKNTPFEGWDLDEDGFSIQKYCFQGMRYGWRWIFHPKILDSRDEIRMKIDFPSKNTGFEGWDFDEHRFFIRKSSVG